jgi:hypothetical protein
MVPASPPRRGDAAKDDSTALSLLPQSNITINTVSEGPVIGDFFALKLQEVLHIPHQRHDSAVNLLLRWSASDDLPTLQRAVWAVSAAMSATFTRSQDLSNKAQETYMTALKSLKGELAKNETARGKEVVKARQPPVSLEMIAGAAIFVWYEATISTTVTAWIEHAKGASRLLLSRHPKDFQSSYGFAIFRTV